MTFEQFQATRVFTPDLNKDCESYYDGSSEQVQPGNIYAGSLYIEQVAPWWPEAARAEGAWHLLLHTDEYISDDLEALERRLYRWAESENYSDEPNDLEAWQKEAYEIAAKWIALIGGGFHPDTRGKDYVWLNTDGKRLLSDGVAAEYDGDMDRLFAIAEDAYATAVAALHDANEGEA